MKSTNDSNIIGEDRNALIMRTTARNTGRNGKHVGIGKIGGGSVGLPKMGAMPSYDGGGDVPQDQVAVVHEGEKVLTPEQAEVYRAAQGQTELIPTKKSAQSDGLIPTQKPEPSGATDAERLAVKTDQQKAMGQGVNGLVRLGTANLHAKSLGITPVSMSTDNTEQPAAPQLIASNVTPAAPQQVQRIGIPRIADVPSTAAPATGSTEDLEARGLAARTQPAPGLVPLGFKAQLAQLKQDHSDALAERSPEGKVKADYILAQINDLQKSNPYGSAQNHPGVLGKIGHIAAGIGNIAGDILAPKTMSLIPGTQLNKGLAANKLQEETQADQRAATASDVANAKEEPKAPSLHELTGGAVDPQHPELGRQQALYNEKTGEISYKGPAKPEKLAASETPANDTQIAEATTQLPAITRALTPDERKAFAFPTGYKPTVPEIKANNELASKANAEKLAGNRDAFEKAKQDAADTKLKKQDTLNEQVAHDIAPMDAHSLSRLKDITSMRSEDREDVYVRAHKLNQDFSTAEVDRRVKMLDDFTNGKSAQNIQSFGTFFEHAGNASQIVNGLRNGATPKIANVAINKLEKEGWGTTATQLSAALEPVRKEFEGFLLGGRALYADDRKAAETILSDSSTPAQVQSALKVLAHTASARYNEMNNRFKNTMKVNIDEGAGPLAPEAYDAAGHLGITEMGGMELKNGKQGYGWYPKEK